MAVHDSSTVGLLVAGTGAFLKSLKRWSLSALDEHTEGTNIVFRLDFIKDFALRFAGSPRVLIQSQRVS
jgi:hypothetical protein